MKFRRKLLSIVKVHFPDLECIVSEASLPVFELVEKSLFPDNSAITQLADELEIAPSKIRQVLSIGWASSQFEYIEDLKKVFEYQEKELYSSIAKLVIPEPEYTNIFVLNDVVVGWDPNRGIVLDIVEDDYFTIARSSFALCQGARFFRDSMSLARTSHEENWEGNQHLDYLLEPDAR